MKSIIDDVDGIANRLKEISNEPLEKLNPLDAFQAIDRTYRPEAVSESGDRRAALLVPVTDAEEAKKVVANWKCCPDSTYYNLSPEGINKSDVEINTALEDIEDIVYTPECRYEMGDHECKVLDYDNSSFIAYTPETLGVKAGSSDFYSMEPNSVESVMDYVPHMVGKTRSTLSFEIEFHSYKDLLDRIGAIKGYVEDNESVVKKMTLEKEDPNFLNRLDQECFIGLEDEFDGEEGIREHVTPRIPTVYGYKRGLTYTYVNTFGEEFDLEHFGNRFETWMEPGCQTGEDINEGIRQHEERFGSKPKY
jgi:hypothetical protein